MKSIFDLLDTCDEFANMSETTLMNSNDKKILAYCCCSISNRLFTIVSSNYSYYL